LYQVFDNEKPADCFNYDSKYGSYWSISIYRTFEEACDYANRWLGKLSEGVVFTLNKPYDYSGYGDIIEIRDIRGDCEYK